MATAVDSERGTWLGAGVHLIGLFFSVLGVALAYLVSSTDFDRRNAKNALNWHIPFFIAWNKSAVVAFIGVGLASAGWVGSVVSRLLILLGLFGLLVLGLANLVVCFVATSKAFNGESWEYPIVPELV
ncbi:DUF4870 domain-containing protein [Natrinema altunense]|uniref:DUF4870 domain-containing protein n=1 Tax=Natrinema altunense TaxID=222984 RepID=A0A482XY69_9EURY|nr:DUF4870 domain-containing protein [Natrinema altunense]RZH68641.1 DUF4870 domain-containing protein [Natrinema altunense]